MNPEENRKEKNNKEVEERKEEDSKEVEKRKEEDNKEVEERKKEVNKEVEKRKEEDNEEVEKRKEEDEIKDILQRAQKLYEDEEDKFAEAEAAFSSVLRLNPRSEAALSGRAGCYLMMGAEKLELASSDIDLCLTINHQSSDGYCKKGLLLLQQKKPWEAKAMFKTAIQLREDNQEAAVGYRRCLALLDQDFNQARIRSNAQPLVQKCLNDQKMKNVLKLMEEDPMAARRVMRESVEVRENLHMLVQSGAIMFR